MGAVADRMSSRASLIMLSLLVLLGMGLVSAYPRPGEGRYQTSYVKRGNYDNIMEQFGSDGYLYDFAKKRSPGFGKSKYPILMGGYGSWISLRFYQVKYNYSYIIDMICTYVDT